MTDNNVGSIVSERNVGQGKDSNDNEATETKEPVAKGSEQMSEKKPIQKIDQIKWIQANIKMRKCSHYIHQKRNFSLCQCGYSREKHTGNVQSQPKESPKTKIKWNYTEHTQTEPTNAFGEITFNNVGGNIAKFVRVESEIDMSTLLYLMIDVWGMKKPKLLISVADGANKFEMKSRLLEACQRGLMKAVQGTGAWIITSGIHAGVTKYVGKVVKELRTISTDKQPIITIGITPWGIVANKHQLENRKESWSAQYSIEKETNTRESFLDPYHSHFILVDNGTQHKSDTTIDFRDRLEKEIAQMKIHTRDAIPSNTDVTLSTHQERAAQPVLEKAIPSKTDTNPSTRQESAAQPEVGKAIPRKTDANPSTRQESAAQPEVGKAIPRKTDANPSTRQESAAQPEVGKAIPRKTDANSFTRQESAAQPEVGKGIPSKTDANPSTRQESVAQPEVGKAIPSKTDPTSSTHQERAAQPEVEKDAVSVPVVLLVLEFGPDTLEKVHKSLRKSPPTPAVIVKGSGGKADILTFAFQSGSGKGRSEKPLGKMDTKLENEIQVRMKNTGFCKEQEIEKNISRIKDCRANSNHIYIYEWNPNSGDFDIDVAILKALLKANKNNVIDQLKLALVWKRIDIAKSEIVSEDNRPQIGNLDGIMLSAILLDRVDFVELFLDNGVILKKFLTSTRLRELYNKVSSRSIFKVLMSKTGGKKHQKISPTGTSRDLQPEMIETKSEEVSSRSIFKVSLCKKYQKVSPTTTSKGLQPDMRKTKSEETIQLKDVGRLLRYLRDDFKFTRYNTHTDKTEEASNSNTKGGKTTDENQQNKPEEDNPCLDLFIWSVLNNRQEMAKLFWRHGKDAMAVALLAHTLFSAMSLQIEDRELRIQFDKNRGEFMNLAIGVLKECHRTNEKKAQWLLIRNLSHWGNTSCVLNAVKAKSKQFISQSACQDLLTSIWMGDMIQENGTLKLLICIAIPLLIPRLVKFKEKEDGERADTTNGKSVQIIKKLIDSPVEKVTVTHVTKESGPSEQSQETRNDSRNETKVKICKYYEKIKSFYQAPVVIFFHNVIYYLVFLGLYSYILISKFNKNLSVEEGVLIVWVVTIFNEEIKQVCATPYVTIKAKLKGYITDGWNMLDVIAISLFAIGMSLRASDHPQTFEAARVILGVNLVTFYLKLLHIFSVHKNLGPKLVMIYQMVSDLAYFVVILLVFVVAYAIASHAILYPNTELSFDTIIAIFRRPYWNIYGELLLDEIEDAEGSTVSGKYFVPVLMGVYMLMCNILLLNLLIAMFSSTIQKVQENSYMIWCFQQYSLINEYKNRTCLAPPFLPFMHAIQFIIWIVRKPKCHAGRNAFLHKFDDNRDRELRQFEDVMAKNFDLNGEQADRESISYRLEQKSKTDTGTGSTNLEKKMENMEKQLKWIIKSLKEHNLGASEGGNP